MRYAVLFASTFLFLVVLYVVQRPSQISDDVSALDELRKSNAKLKALATALQVDVTRTSKPCTTTSLDPPTPQEKTQSNPATASSEHILDRVESLVLSEIPFEDPADLYAPSLDELKEYDLFRTPSEHWYERAKAIVEENRENLRHAQHHVDDPGQRVTVVTALLDLGRDKLENVGQFKRSFKEYIERFQRTFNINFPMVVFMDAKHVSEMDTSQHTKGIVIIPFSVDKLQKLFPNYFDRIEAIRNSPLYKRQAQRTGWLQFAPQAALKYYNLLVMTKVYLLRWASQLNPWRTQYHLFVDAGHDCVGALRDTHLDLFRKLMGRMMVTYFDYWAPLNGETHGMTQKAYRTYVGAPHNNPETWQSDRCCKVVRGGIFGGTPAYIDVYARVYNELLSQSLSDGYMGTEENIMGAISYRFPELHSAYHNFDGDNCRLFVDACERSEPDKEIFFQSEVPLRWDSAGRSFISKDSNEAFVESSHKLRG